MAITNKIAPIQTIIATLLVIGVGYLFFTGHLLRFYASMVFGFYALTHKMWVSVILLGVFQTLVLIPLRIIKLRRKASIKDFEDQVNLQQASEDQIKFMKTHAYTGNRAFLLYVVDFLIQLATFLTIGRLFLKDFYTEKLDPNLIYSFIPYPKYPIQSTFFQIPYLQPAQTINLGFGILLAVWIIIIGIQALFFYIRKKTADRKVALPQSINQLSLFITTSTLFFLVISYFLVTKFPTTFKLAIFSGDISQPNNTFNTITAVVTFVTLFWFNLNRIERQSQTAVRAGINQMAIHATEQKLFNQSIRDSALVGLGAYFITNHIPSAFELSVFTLEIISLVSPLTLDKLILRAENQR